MRLKSLYDRILNVPEHGFQTVTHTHTHTLLLLVLQPMLTGKQE